MTFQTLDHTVGTVGGAKQFEIQGVKNAVATLARGISMLNIWNPPHRKTMTVEERAIEDQKMREFVSEW